MAANAYLDLKRTFDFIECSMREAAGTGRCGGLPAQLQGRNQDSILRKYVFSLLLVSVIAQLEDDLAKMTGIAGLGRAGSLSAKLRLVNEHHNVPRDLSDPVDRLRSARNAFVHDGDMDYETGCTKSNVPGILTSFLHRCNHPDFP